MNQRNGYNDTVPDPMFKSFKEMRTVLQERLPPSPRPKEIKHVILDADDTIWELEPWGIASLASPIGKTDEDVLPTKLSIEEFRIIPEWWGDIQPQGSVRLDPTLRETLQKLKAKGIPVSIASSNTKRSVMAFLEAFGLTDSFADVEASLSDAKSDMVRKIAKRQKVDTKDILFINDSTNNAFDVSINTDAISLIMGYNIIAIEDLLEYIK